MNKKRWIAVLIAAGLLVVSLVSSSLTQPQEEVQMGNINSWLYGDDEMSPVVLEEAQWYGKNRKIDCGWRHS